MTVSRCRFALSGLMSLISTRLFQQTLRNRRARVQLLRDDFRDTLPAIFAPERVSIFPTLSAQLPFRLCGLQQIPCVRGYLGLLQRRFERIDPCIPCHQDASRRDALAQQCVSIVHCGGEVITRQIGNQPAVYFLRVRTARRENAHPPQRVRRGCSVGIPRARRRVRWLCRLVRE